MLLITTGVFFRYVLVRPLPGDVELVEFMMVIVVMMGLGYTQATGGHVSVKILVDRLSPRVQARIDIFNFIVAAAMLSLIVWRSFEYGLISYSKLEASDILMIPLFIFRFVIPIGFLVWVLEAIVKVYLSIKLLKEPG